VEAVEFYEGLEADNSKAYWTAHKAVWEQKVRAPMEELLRELAPQFGEGKIFRPYRDVRFSRDKSPYKTSLAAVLSSGGYIQLDSAGLGVGAGMYTMEPAPLDRFRKAIVDDRTGGELDRLVAELRRKRIEISAHGSLKTAPKGYSKGHPRADLLRQKGLIAWKQWPAGAWLGTKQAKTRVEDFLHTAGPLLGWLRKNVGELHES
jgi:uncharacterized protein (TIGR02453 family)